MKRKSRPWFLAGITLLGLLGAQWLLTSRQPMYRGKPISVWFDAYSGYRPDPFAKDRFPSVDEAKKAFDAMGTSAVPFLVAKLHPHDSVI
ncbi:MAG: hypothetical protein KGS61_20850, partial [Verrucomicrobia bacterium]|nr:hypothetical protein [Verrucomicrobiota bacterium]